MKVYQIYTTNVWQDDSSRENIGVASDIETARAFVRSALDDNSSEFKVIIEVCNVDEYEGYSKVEVYDFQDGLEWKSNESDAEIGSLSTTKKPVFIECINSDKTELSVYECTCGFHLGIDSTYLEQVGEVSIPCPCCGKKFITANDDECKNSNKT